MKTVFQMFWRMCLLKQNPAQVPTQNWFVATVIGANLLTSIIVSFSIEQTAGTLEISTRIVVGQATTAALIWLATFLREFPNRFAGTLTALFGCDLIITACFGLLVPILMPFGDNALMVLTLAALVWSLSVTGFIVAQALSVQISIGILLALGIAVLSTATSQLAIGA